MNAKELDLLGEAFNAEVSAALQKHGIDIYQPRKAKLAVKLAAEGYLEPASMFHGAGFPRVEIKGYRLTHLGRMTYCMSALDDAAGAEN